LAKEFEASIKAARIVDRRANSNSDSTRADVADSLFLKEKGVFSKLSNSLSELN
jgi:hypothetical protein